MKELLQIQQELDAPKNQWNAHGNYKYRSCEDILEGLKPILKATECVLVVSDTIEQIGERYYIKATSILYRKDATIVAQNTAYAREANEQKGMQAPMLSGSTSSFARKYSLNGLFAIDDSRDPDSMDNTDIPAPKSNNEEEDDKPWLNNKTPEEQEIYAKMITALKTGKRTMQDLRKKYKISKTTCADLENKAGV